MIVHGPAQHDQNSTILSSISGSSHAMEWHNKDCAFRINCVVDCKGLVHLGHMGEPDGRFRP
jgi:hypothetical protein